MKPLQPEKNDDSSHQLNKIFKKVKEYVKNNVDDLLAVPYIWKRYKDKFLTLVSIILSIRTKEELTLKASENLFKKYKKLDDFLNAKEEDIERLIKGVGLSKQKAKWIKNCAKIIKEKFNGEVPEEFNSLISLPGVGRKVANVYLSLVLGKDVIGVDTHVFRIIRRITGIHFKNPEEVEEFLYKNLDKKYWKELNEIFVLFGRNVCLPKKPKCYECPIKEYCKNENRRFPYTFEKF